MWKVEVKMNVCFVAVARGKDRKLYVPWPSFCWAKASVVGKFMYKFMPERVLELAKEKF